jgi:hypothetical protein
MTADDYCRGRLVDVAWQVAGKISFPAAVAVMFVIRNVVERNKDNNWIRAIDETYAGGAYSEPDTRDPEFQKLLEVVDSVYEGTKVDSISNNALYFESGEGREECASVGGFRIFKDARKESE